MRISGGRARGIPLVVPRGNKVRPATDGLRQAVFSSLGARVTECLFLDLFAGSGAYGLEALSRGARGGAWVERQADAVSCIRRNITAVCRSLERPETGLQVLPADATGVPWQDAVPPDLVFIDPPYDQIGAVAPRLFRRLSEVLGSHRDPLVVMEMPGEMELSLEGWSSVKRLGKGVRQPTVCFFKPVRGALTAH